jgi:hypothetical protein
MRARQAMGGVGDAEVAVLRVGAQPVGLEILFAVMASASCARSAWRRQVCVPMISSARLISRRRARPSFWLSFWP